MIDLSSDQQQALTALQDWFTTVINRKQAVTLGGYAGTGKTTLIAEYRFRLSKSNPKLKVAFCAYTGKASRVLRSKLVESSCLYPQDTVSTIHGLIYSPIEDDHEVIVGWQLKDKLETDLIIVDEASMVDVLIWHDLLSYQIPILAVGDHGQLPPIREGFNLMETPELKLEHIHRQAAQSPIIKLSILAREDGYIPFGTYGVNIKKLDSTDSGTQEEISNLLARYNQQTLILCGYNSTRLKLNRHLRNQREFESDLPQIGDRVICLRNNHAAKVMNGMLGTVQMIRDKDESWHDAVIEMDGESELYQGLIYRPQFYSPDPTNFTKNRYLAKKGDLFDFGYALTVHKAQGSQAKKVILFEERFPKMTDSDWRRWLYTAVTRAEQELFVIGR